MNTKINRALAFRLLSDVRKAKASMSLLFWESVGVRAVRLPC